MATTTGVTVAFAKTTLLKIEGNMGSTWWNQLATNFDNAQRCRERLREIAGGSETHSIEGAPADLFLLL